MKIVGDTIKKDVVTKAVRTVVGVECDLCKKSIVGLYAHVMTQHSRWGNDSCDSTEHHDYCFECVKKVFDSYTFTPDVTDEFVYYVEDTNDSVNEEYVEVKPDGSFITLEDTYSYKVEK